MVVLIGNSPSSGSSFLADLLDATPFSCCGEELGLFSNRRIYSFKEYQKRPFRKTYSPSLYCHSNGINISELHSYGLSREDFSRLCASATSLEDFAESFKRYVFSMRGKDPRGILFEKTPQNISCAAEFLDAFPNSYFIHLVRNPLYVYTSLLKRQFPPYLALGTWLVDMASYYKCRHHDRMILVRYEDLVKKPFKTAVDLIRQISSIELSEEDIEHGYKSNDYRRFHTYKMRSWSINEYGLWGDANRKTILPAESRDFASSFHLKIRRAYAAHYGLPEISFEQAVSDLGYADELKKYKVMTNELPQKTVKDMKKLFLKWLHDVKNGYATISSLACYVKPFEHLIREPVGGRN